MAEGRTFDSRRQLQGRLDPIHPPRERQEDEIEFYKREAFHIGNTDPSINKLNAENHDTRLGSE
jgi:hypothetical protein